MPPTLSEVRAAQAPTRLREQLAETEGLLKSAAVSSEKLTGSPEWDQYLQKLQPLLDEAKKECTDWLARLAAAGGDTDVRVAQFNYHYWNSRVILLQEVMLLPKAIMEAHRESRTNTY